VRVVGQFVPATFCHAELTRSVAVGGDHGITLPILRALGRSEGVRLGVLQIDAHHDTHDVLYGVEENHATSMRRSVEDGIVDPKRVVQVGLRGSLYSPDEFDATSRIQSG